MAADEVHKDDIGTIFRATIKDGSTAVDVSSATTLQFFFRKPDASLTVDTQTAVLTGDGTDGIIEYISTSGDLDTIGTWQLQAKIVLDVNNQFKTDWHKFEVHENIA